MPDTGSHDSGSLTDAALFPPHMGGGWELLPELLRSHACAVSIYLPLDPENRDLRAPDARLRNLIDVACHRLAEAGCEQSATSWFVDPARQLAASSDFARHRPGGLVLLFAEGLMRTLQLPALDDEQVIVGRHFHIKPLLNLVAHNQRFHVLAFSRGNVELWTATPFGHERVPLDLPHATLQAELDSRLAAHVTPEDDEAARKAILVEDPQRVAAAVRDALGDDRAPIVLAGDPHVIGHFAKLARMEQILPQTLQVNPFGLDPDTLHRRTVEIIAPRLDEDCQAVLDLAQARLGSAAPTVAIRLEEILQAAQEGRVDSVKRGTVQEADCDQIAHVLRRERWLS